MSQARQLTGTAGELERSLPRSLARYHPPISVGGGGGGGSSYKWLVHKPNIAWPRVRRLESE